MASVFAHTVRIESADCGVALGRLEPAARADLIEAEAVLALAHHCGDAALRGIAAAVGGAIRCAPAQSNITHFRGATGALSAAALVDRELPCYVADDIRRDGNVRARVNVALVDDDGEPVALGVFEFEMAQG